MVLGTGWHPQVDYPGDGSQGLAFAQGGAVTWPFNVTASKTKIPSLAEVQRAALFGSSFSGNLAASLVAAVAFVKSQVGKPYGWAEAGPFAYDCSGIGSAAWNVAHGRNPYSHTFSTATERGFFPLSGYGAFTAAWGGPGEAGGGRVGHTAFKIGNYQFESTGSRGVHDGASVTPLSSFAHIGHYDQGGDLPPGLTLAYNGTGRPETVLTQDQVRAFASQLGGNGHVVNQTVNASEAASAHEVADLVMNELIWHLR
jgi:hypothetical protein